MGRRRWCRWGIRKNKKNEDSTKNKMSDTRHPWFKHAIKAMFMVWGMYHGSLLSVRGLYFWAVHSYEIHISVKWMQKNDLWDQRNYIQMRPHSMSDNKRQQKEEMKWNRIWWWCFLTSRSGPETWSMGPKEECFKRLWLHAAHVFFIRSLLWFSVEPIHVPKRQGFLCSSEKLVRDNGA